MIISPYSLVLTLFWFALFITLADHFRRKTGFLSHYNIFGLLALVFLGFVRLFLPIELPFTVIIRSEKIVPKVVWFFSYPLFTIGAIKVSLMMLLMLIWSSVALYRLLQFFKRLNHDRNQLKAISYEQNHHVEQIMSKVASKMRLSKNYRLLVSPDISEPLLVGVIKPTILIPDVGFNDDNLATILAHEGQHIRSKDQYIKLIINFVAAVMWWVPAAQRMIGHIDDALELRCDSVLTRDMNRQEKMRYLEIMQYTYNHVVDTESDISLSSRFASHSKDILTERFEAMLNHNKSSKKFLLTFTAIFLLTFVFSFCIIVQPYYDPPIVEDVVIIDSNNSYIIYSDGCYWFYYSDKYSYELSDDELTKEPYCLLPIIVK